MIAEIKRVLILWNFSDEIKWNLYAHGRLQKQVKALYIQIAYSDLDTKKKLLKAKIKTCDFPPRTSSADDRC